MLGGLDAVGKEPVLAIARDGARPPADWRGWSQTALGDRLGVSRQTINAIENGRYDPSLPLAFAIARVFGESIERIFAGETTTDQVQVPHS